MIDIHDKIQLAKGVPICIDGMCRQQAVSFFIVDQDALSSACAKNNIVVAHLLLFQKPQGMRLFIFRTGGEEDNHILTADLLQKLFCTGQEGILPVQKRPIVPHDRAIQIQNPGFGHFGEMNALLFHSFPPFFSAPPSLPAFQPASPAMDCGNIFGRRPAAAANQPCSGRIPLFRPGLISLGLRRAMPGFADCIVALPAVGIYHDGLIAVLADLPN